MIYLVNDRNDCQLSFKSQVEVGHCLCLNSLKKWTKKTNPQKITHCSSAACAKTTLIQGQLSLKKKLGMYLISIDDQKDTLTCRNWSRYFITKVHVTLEKENVTRPWKLLIIRGFNQCTEAKRRLKNALELWKGKRAGENTLQTSIKHATVSQRRVPGYLQTPGKNIVEKKTMWNSTVATYLSEMISGAYFETNQTVKHLKIGFLPVYQWGSEGIVDPGGCKTARLSGLSQLFPSLAPPVVCPTPVCFSQS